MVRSIRLRNKRRTAELYTELLENNYNVCKRTVLRNLRKVATLRLSRPQQRPLLTRQHMKQRLLWARKFLNQNFDWRTALFADEKVWYVDGPTLRRKLWHDKRDPPLILPRTGARNVKVHVWGAFSAGYVPDLVFVNQPMDAVEYCRVLSAANLGSTATQRYTLFHDRHPVHQSKRTTEWLVTHGVRTELLPPKAADLNPIENLWAWLDTIVYPQNKTYHSKESLVTAINEAWQRVQADRLMRLKYMDSMTGRLTAVVREKGGWTKH